MPLSHVEGRSSGYEREIKSQETITPDDPPAQALPPECLAEWCLELKRRLARAEALAYLGLPDAGFALLAEEIHRFSRASCVILQGRAA
jgi:hypothetical protein